MSTDEEWEKWAKQDPYFSVLTAPRFRNASLTAEAKSVFFEMGRHHVAHVLGICRSHLDTAFTPHRILDFGCGVGRLVVPFATGGSEVVGVDISPTMLQEARRNCEAAGVMERVEFALSDDTLSQVTGEFDLVHTCIVIQHIEIPRGLQLITELVRRIRPGGIGALHVTFAWDIHRETYGIPPPLQVDSDIPWWRRWRRSVRSLLPGKATQTTNEHRQVDPEMQMNFYNLSQIMFVLHQVGAEMVHSQLTDHGGAIGAFLFFKLPVK
jgi:SAM-dependent methyltransferase